MAIFITASNCSSVGSGQWTTTTTTTARTRAVTSDAVSVVVAAAAMKCRVDIEQQSLSSSVMALVAY